MTESTGHDVTNRTCGGLNVTPWIVQGLLALTFGRNLVALDDAVSRTAGPTFVPGYEIQPYSQIGGSRSGGACSQSEQGNESPPN